MISLLFFTGRPLPTGHRSRSPGRYLAVRGEVAGHHRGGKWPPMGSISWPLSGVVAGQQRHSPVGVFDPPDDAGEHGDQFGDSGDDSFGVGLGRADL
jgi:hypothetical protein